MTHVFCRNAHEKSVSFGQETMVPSTVIECPPMKVIGIRAYTHTTGGEKALGEVTIDKPDKALREKIKAFKRRGKKKAKEEEAKYGTVETLEKDKAKVSLVTLIVQVQPAMTGIGKKKADVAEVRIAGSIEQQFAFAKERIGKEIRIGDCFAASQFIDVRAVDKGKGFAGVVKRAHVKVHRPKSKKHRYVGSIGPWHPATVMWTVARPGQLGYQVRTEYNKRVLAVENKAEAINPVSGFGNYGMVKNDFIVLVGSVPGPAKRIVAMRPAIRINNENLAKYTDIKLPNAGVRG